MGESSADVVRRYLENAIAAERTYEAQLLQFAEEGAGQAAAQVFHQHALETKSQHERLTARLEALGGSPSGTKSVLSYLFAPSTKVTQTRSHDQHTTHNLISAFTVENNEVAMYEALFAVAEAAGDPDTASLSRTIQSEERSTAEKLWSLLPDSVLAEPPVPADKARAQQE